MSPTCKKKKIVLSRNRKTQASETTRPDKETVRVSNQLSTVTPRQQRMEAILRRQNNSLEIYEAEPMAGHLLFTDVEEKSKQDESEPERLTTRPFNEIYTQEDSICPQEILIKEPLMSRQLNNDPSPQASQYSTFKPYQCSQPVRVQPAKSFLSVTLKETGAGTSRPHPSQKNSISIQPADAKLGGFTRSITESTKNTIFVSFVKRSPSTSPVVPHRISSERYREMGAVSRCRSQSRLGHCNSIKLIKQV